MFLFHNSYLLNLTLLFKKKLKSKLTTFKKTKTNKKKEISISPELIASST